MAISPSITRRAAVIGALTSSAAVAAPAVAAINPTEHPNNKVRRLGREIMETLRDPEFIGFNRITITPQYVGYSAEPDAELIELAREFIRLVAAAYVAQDIAYAAQDETRVSFIAVTGKSLKGHWDEYSAFFDSTPARSAEDAMSEAWRKVEELGDRIRSRRAIGLGGVWAKLVVLQNDHGYRDIGPRREQDLGEERFNSLLDEIGQAVGLTI